jgi:Phage tail protein
MPLVSLRTAIATLGTGDPNERVIGTKHSGPRGIEAVIEFNGLYLNVRDWVDTYLVTNILGIDDADVRDTREPNPGRHGETPGISLYGGRTIALQGKIQTKTIWKLRDMEQALRGAFADLSAEQPLIFHANTPENDLQIFCKKSQKIDMPDAQSTLNGFERPFNITLRASNPRFTSVVRRYNSLVFPGSTYDAIGFTVVNTGNFPSEPYIELRGPLVAPQLSNEANGDVIKFAGTIPNGEIWVYDATGPKIYRKSDLADRWSYVDPTSTEFLYEPEIPNPIRFTATGLTVASGVTSWNEDTLM